MNLTVLKKIEGSLSRAFNNAVDTLGGQHGFVAAAVGWAAVAALWAPTVVSIAPAFALVAGAGLAFTSHIYASEYRKERRAPKI